MISSQTNETVRLVGALQKKADLRREKGLFVVEGKRLAAEAPPERIVRLFMTEAFSATSEGKAMSLRGRTELVSESVMLKMSDTKTPQGVLALVSMPEGESPFKPDAPLLFLEHIQDPGNVGTLFRTAEAAGAGGILMDEETADPFSPKVIRSTMGAIFRVPFKVCRDIPGEIAALKKNGYRIFAAHLEAEESFDSAVYPARCVVMLGNEGNGLSAETAALADARLRIPMEGKTESLNVSVAGALLLYEAYRQRRAGQAP